MFGAVFSRQKKRTGFAVRSMHAIALFNNLAKYQYAIISKHGKSLFENDICFYRRSPYRVFDLEIDSLGSVS